MLNKGWILFFEYAEFITVYQILISLISLMNCLYFIKTFSKPCTCQLPPSSCWKSSCPSCVFDSGKYLSNKCSNMYFKGCEKSSSVCVWYTLKVQKLCRWEMLRAMYILSLTSINQICLSPLTIQVWKTCDSRNKIKISLINASFASFLLMYNVNPKIMNRLQRPMMTATTEISPCLLLSMLL